MNKKRKILPIILKAVSRIFSVSVVLAAIILFQSLAGMDVLPQKYNIAVVLVMIVLIGLAIALQFHRKTRAISAVLLIVFTLVFITGNYYLLRSSDTLEKMTASETSTDVITLYVLKTDSASKLTEISGGKIGILKTLDRKNTDAALKAASHKTDEKLTTQEYENSDQLVNALIDKKVQAILLNSAYLSLVTEAEDGSSAADDVKSVWTYEIERKLEIQDQKTDNSAKEDTEKTEAKSDNTKKDSTESKDSSKDDTTAKKTTKSITDSPFVLYVSGNDSEGELKANGRSDVNMLIAVNPQTGKILLVNTPRDYYVNLPGIGELDKLTHAGIYGVDESMKTLAELYGIPIQYYVKLNFTGFEEIIDALGGVTVESDVDFTVANWHYVVGENDLSGIEALAFARERYSFTTGDRQRGKNQQAVIRGVVKKVCSPAILTNYLDLLHAAEGTVETNMAMKDITALVKYQLDKGINWDIESISADGTGDQKYCYSAGGSGYVMMPDQASVDVVKAKLNEILN